MMKQKFLFTVERSSLPGLWDGVIAPGAHARLVVFEGRSFSDLLSRPTGPRLLVDHEEVHAPQLPSFRELAS